MESCVKKKINKFDMLDHELDKDLDQELGTKIHENAICLSLSLYYNSDNHNNQINFFVPLSILSGVLNFRINELLNPI